MECDGVRTTGTASDVGLGAWAQQRAQHLFFRQVLGPKNAFDLGGMFRSFLLKFST